MPSFGLSLRPRVLGRTSDMIDAVMIEPFSEFIRDITGAKFQGDFLVAIRNL